MTTPTVIETRRAGQTNARVEIARYTISAGERVIYGQRVLGVVRFLPRSRVVVAAFTGGVTKAAGVVVVGRLRRASGVASSSDDAFALRQKRQSSGLA